MPIRGLLGVMYENVKKVFGNVSFKQWGMQYYWRPLAKWIISREISTELELELYDYQRSKKSCNFQKSIYFSWMLDQYHTNLSFLWYACAAGSAYFSNFGPFVTSNQHPIPLTHGKHLVWISRKSIKICFATFGLALATLHWYVILGLKSQHDAIN